MTLSASVSSTLHLDHDPTAPRDSPTCFPPSPSNGVPPDPDKGPDSNPQGMLPAPGSPKRHPTARPGGPWAQLVRDWYPDSSLLLSH